MTNPFSRFQSACLAAALCLSSALAHAQDKRVYERAQLGDVEVEFIKNSYATRNFPLRNFRHDDERTVPGQVDLIRWVPVRTLHNFDFQVEGPEIDIFASRPAGAEERKAFTQFCFELADLKKLFPHNAAFWEEFWHSIRCYDR